jgi:SAM-dependent methyltransferase
MPELPGCGMIPDCTRSKFPSRPAHPWVGRVSPSIGDKVTEDAPQVDESNALTRWSAYRCPRTRARLTLEGSRLRASSDESGYPVRHEIPWFLRYEPVEKEEIRDKLEQLNESAKRDGWREALKRVYGVDSDLYRYVTDPNRQALIELLPLTPHSVVLEIGPGLGQMTSCIAEQVEAVYALEVVPGQAYFTAERCRQEGRSNVSVACGGDDCFLPYPDNSFDVVVLNLVLEWCASRSTDEEPRTIQRRLLRESYRVLKGGGVIYLATKNRYALRYLIGKSDEHAYGIRFGSALPRWLLFLLLRFRGRKRPAGVLYSYARMRRMLLSVGFVDPRSFWAAPEMRFPRDYVETDTALVRAARRQVGFEQGEMRSTRLLMPVVPAVFVKYLTPGLLFLASKPR